MKKKEVNPMKHPVLFTFALSLGSIAFAASDARCAPEPPATCYPDECCRTYCLGPDNMAINAPVRPYTCNGDWAFEIEGFYWNAHQDGMEFAVLNATQPVQEDNLTFIDAKYQVPNFKWEFGFKAGIGYNTTCDSWDFGILWTSYTGKARTHLNIEVEDNQTLLPIWSSFDGTNSASPNPTFQLPLFATDIRADWDLNLDLVDLELGRAFWSSKRVSLRHHIGLRFANIRQNYHIEHRGGSWSRPTPRLNNFVDLDNDFKGVGMRSGLDTLWTFGCGWSVYGDTAVSLIYGRFSIDHAEQNRDAVPSFTKNKFFDTEDSVRASRLAFDFNIGIEWAALFCNCDYRLAVRLGWENHLFLNQNQMWRVYKVLGVNASNSPLPQNTLSQRRGDLDTQGWTLAVKLDF